MWIQINDIKSVHLYIFICYHLHTFSWGAGPDCSQTPKSQATLSILGLLCFPGQCQARCAVPSSLFPHAAFPTCIQSIQEHPAAPTAPAAKQDSKWHMHGHRVSLKALAGSDPAVSLCVPSCAACARKGWLPVPIPFPNQRLYPDPVSHLRQPRQH